MSQKSIRRTNSAPPDNYWWVRDRGFEDWEDIRQPLEELKPPTKRILADPVVVTAFATGVLRETNCRRRPRKTARALPYDSAARCWFPYERHISRAQKHKRVIQVSRFDATKLMTKTHCAKCCVSSNSQPDLDPECRQFFCALGWNQYRLFEVIHNACGKKTGLISVCEVREQSIPKIVRFFFP